MKYLLKITIVLASFLFVISCENSNQALPERSKKSENMPYLELDMTAISAKKSLSSKEQKYATEVLYSAFKRAYEYLEVENNLYKLNVSKGKDIQISESLFNIIKGTIDDTNQMIREQRAQGKDVGAVEDLQVVPSNKWSWEQVVELYGMYN